MQTRSGLTPVWQTAKKLAGQTDELLSLVQWLIREASGAESTPSSDEPDQDTSLLGDAEREVEAFFRTYRLSYNTCYYIAIAVYDGCAYNDIRPFADALWSEFQKTFVEASPDEIRENSFLSVREILELAKAENVETDEDGSRRSRIVRFRNRYVARACTRIVMEDYPLLSECLLRTCVARLLEEPSRPCERLLEQWAVLDYPAVVRAITEASESNGPEDMPSSQSENVMNAGRRLTSALLNVIESAARTPRWRPRLLETAEELMREETAGLAGEPTLRSLRIVRSLSGSASGEGGNTNVLKQFYSMICGWALDWYQKKAFPVSRWAVLLYTLFYLDENEPFWVEMSRLIAEDMASEQKDQRIAGITCLTFLLYGDCLLVEDNRPVMGILRHCSAKRSHRAETAALLRRFCEKNSRFLCMETVLDEQIVILDEKDPQNRQLWPFFKWIAFTGRSEDYSRWHDYLSLKTGRTRYSSAISAEMIQKMEKAIASVN